MSLIKEVRCRSRNRLTLYLTGQYESYAPSVVLLFANILLMARVYALNKKNKMILGVLW